MDYIEELKIRCVEVALEGMKAPGTFDPNSDILVYKLEKLVESLEAVPRDDVSTLAADVVYFPSERLLEHESLGWRSTELLFKCSTILCRTAWSCGEVLTLQRASELISVTSYLLSPTVPQADEDGAPMLSKQFLEKPTTYHTAAFKLLDAIFKSAYKSPIHEPSSRSPIIIDVITFLLGAIQHDDKDIDAQCSSITCLETVVVEIIMNPEHRALVLPRTVSKLTRLLSHANKRHFAVKVAALNSLTNILMSTLADSTFKKQPNKIRTTEWIETTMKNLGLCFNVIEKSQRVLLEVTGAKVVLLKAIYSLAHEFLTRVAKLLDKYSNIAESLVNIVLLTASQTHSTSLAQKALKFLASNDSTLHTKVETYTSKHLEELPNLLSNASESSVNFQIQTLQNALQITTSFSNFETIVDAVERGLPLKIKKQMMQKPAHIRHIETFDPNREKFSDSTDIGFDVELSSVSQSQLASMLSVVGSKLTPQEACDAIGVISNRLRALDMRAAKSLSSTGLLWITVNILRGSPRDADIYDLISYCFENVDRALTIEETDTVSVSSASSHTALCCYVLGETALLQGCAFKEYLVDLVYPLFALIGHPESQIIRKQAALAISKVSSACGYTSPQDLAISNKDYLIDGWSLQINTLNMTPGTFDSLASLIFISGDSIIPYLDDVFASLFVLMNRYYGYSKLVKGVLAVFGALTFVVTKNFAPEKSVKSTQRKLESFDDLLAEIIRKPEVDPTILNKKIDLENFMKPKSDDDLSSDGQEDEESDNEDIKDEPEQTIETWNYAIPKPAYLTLERVVDYCDRLLTHESSDIRMATLILITELMPCLAINKEKFLPLIHKTWPEATTRVFDKEVYVVEQSFRCIGTMATYAQDFVTSRLDKSFPTILAKYAELLTHKWPPFTVEQRITTAFSEFFKTIVEQVSDLSLVTLEAGILAFRPALLRGELPKSKHSLLNTKSDVADLLWLVLLQSPEQPPSDLEKLFGFHTVMPVYKQ